MDISTIMVDGRLQPYRQCFRPMMVDGKLDLNAGAAYILKPEYAMDVAYEPISDVDILKKEEGRC